MFFRCLALFCLLWSQRGFCEEKVFFLHIPKSGGITLSSIFLDHFPMDSSYRLEWHKFNFFHLQQHLPDIQLLYGHTPYQQLMEASEGFWKITFLRDPVARVLSEQRYVLDRVHIDPNAKAVRYDHLLPPNGDPIDTASNVSCKMLSRLDPFDPAISMQRHLESAKEVLVNDFDFVGITERMEESIEQLCELLGWSIPGEIPIHNTTEPSERVYSQEVLDGIEKRNWADRELYEFAKELFEEKARQKTTVFIEEGPIEWTSEVFYDFRGPLDGYGWCSRERWEGDVFRWLASSEKGCIDFPLAPDDYIVEMEVFIHRSLLKKISFFANQTRLAHKIFISKLERGEYRWCTLRAILPKSCIISGEKTRMTFVIFDPSYIRPKDSYRGRCGSKKITIQRSIFS